MKNGWITKEITDPKTGKRRPAKLYYQNGKIVKRRWLKYNNFRRAKKLGASFKKGYPSTYTKSQTKPVYRTQKAAQQRELDRLVAASNMNEYQAKAILERKYAKKDMEFLPNA
jgi:predicted DNA-binding ArsR family transcriptional regulator